MRVGLFRFLNEEEGGFHSKELFGARRHPILSLQPLVDHVDAAPLHSLHQSRVYEWLYEGVRADVQQGQDGHYHRRLPFRHLHGLEVPFSPFLRLLLLPLLLI